MKHVLSRSMGGALALAALALLAFGPRPKVDAPKDRVRIQYWEKWTGQEGEQIRQIVDTFNDTVGKENGIWVDLVSMSQIERKTLIATAAGVPPDVAGLFDTQLCQFASKGALENLDEYARQAGLTRDQFKPAFYDGCTWQGHLYALPSAPWAPALLWNKQIFDEYSEKLRAAGLDPTRPPQTIAELDRYAQVFDTWVPGPTAGSKRLKLTGYVPLEPGWWIQETVWWFGGDIVDKSGTHVLLSSPEMIASFDWMRGYSERLGKDALENFRGGFGSFDSPQNAFLTGQTAMVKQGPWMFSFIEKLNPSMNRWRVPAEQLRREKMFANIATGMSIAQVKEQLGEPTEIQSDGTYRWAAGVRDIFIRFENDRVTDARAPLLPARERQKYCVWGVTPFPSVSKDLPDVTYAGMDLLAIPSASRHKKEAFEFIAFLNRQDQSERFNSMHCSLSPLAKVSESFLRDHPNPYVDVFEKLISSPNAHPAPPVPSWPELTQEIQQEAQRACLLEAPSKQLLEQLQKRAQRELDQARME